MDNNELLIKIKDMFDTKVDEVKVLFDTKVDEVKVLFDTKIDEVKVLFDTKIDEVKRHTSILIENIEKKVEIVAEGHDILNRKLDGVDQDIKSLRADMTIVKDYVVGVDKKLNEHEIILKRVK